MLFRSALAQIAAALGLAAPPRGASPNTASNASPEQTYAAERALLEGFRVIPLIHLPDVDSFGNIFTTFSGSRGQKVPVAVYKIDLNFSPKPFINDLMNATALTFDDQGMLYISSRYDGFVYQVTPNGNMSVYVEGMGVATEIGRAHV